MKLVFKRFLPLTFVLFLAACVGFISQTTSTFYQYEGKTYEVQEFKGNVGNVTMFEIVDGERKFIGFYTLGDPKPEEEVNRRRITNVVENGTQVGEPEVKTQRSIDLELRDDE